MLLTWNSYIFSAFYKNTWQKSKMNNNINSEFVKISLQFPAMIVVPVLSYTARKYLELLIYICDPFFQTKLCAT